MIASSVLFDLDGTLIDSAPDLASAANALRTAQNLAPLPLEAFRPLVGSGARGMLRVALSLTPEHVDFDHQRNEFLRLYQQRMTQQTTVFEHIPSLLARLEQHQIAWGIVTNKVERFAVPIVASFKSLAACRTVIGGDTTPFSKPHPAPLLEAARRMGKPPAQCWYVGDDVRDIQAGRAAGMRTVAVSWGYLGEHADLAQWQADHIIETPQALVDLLTLT